MYHEARDRVSVLVSSWHGLDLATNDQYIQTCLDTYETVRNRQIVWNHFR